MKNHKNKLLIVFIISAVFASCSSGQKKVNKEELLKPEETALLLIEFQNEWLKDGHFLNSSIDMYLSRKNTIRKASELRTYMNKKGVLVVHIPLIYEEGYKEIPNPRGLQKNIVEKGLFLRGSDSAEIYPEFQPLENEIVATGRTGLSAFTGSDLQKILEENNIKNIVLSGIASNVCVAYTSADAFDRGYNVILAADAVATFDRPGFLTFFGFSLLKRINDGFYEGTMGPAYDNNELFSRVTD